MSDPYSVGLATVANGATAVTGTDTFWVGKVRKNDMFFVPAQGLQARVTADPTDNDALAITAWAGTSLVDAAYEIIPASDTTTSAARLRDLLAQMSVIEANGRGLFYRFSDSVTDADPGSGYLRLNNATIGSATAAYIDNLDANGAAVSAVLDSWDDEATAAARGQLWLRSVADPTAFHAFKVSGSVVDGTGYRRLTLTYIGGSSTFAADDEMMVMFSAQGADGTNAILGVWQGAWATATGYDVDDLVEQGGSTYICIEAHTSGTFATDLAADKWELAIEKGDQGIQGPKGAQWDGAWVTATAYAVDDIVRFDGSSYICLIAHTSGAFSTDLAALNWELMVEKGGTGATGAPGGGLKGIACRVAATANVAIATALEAGDAIDGVTLSSGDLVLLTAQTVPAENGVYVASVSGAAARHADFDAWTDFPGSYFPVNEGAANADTLWRCTSNAGGTIGATALVFGKFAFSFTNADALAGSVVQSAADAYTVNAGLSATIPNDDTIPQNTEGTQTVSVTITPRSTTNKLRVRCSGIGAPSGNTYVIMALFVNSNANASRTAILSGAAAGVMGVGALEFEYTPGSVSPQTISLRIGANSGNVALNGTPSGRAFGGSAAMQMVVEEIKA